MDYEEMAHQLGMQGYVQGSELRAKCPLHHDNNPSFSLNIHQGVWICFSGCGKGDFIRLVELVLNCSPQEAHDWVNNNGKPSSVEQLSKVFTTAFNPLEPVAKKPDTGWLDRYETLSSKAMPIWFLTRGFTWSTITKWDIRYDPFSDAVVIPVMDKGVLVGTITRNTIKDLPKYQNSTHLPKSEILFGEISNTHSEIIICEGVLDALWFWQNGYHAVSILGSSLSAKQIGLLQEYRFGEIILALDNDEAGLKGTMDAIKKLTEAGYLLPQIKIMRYPEGAKDAQDCDKESLAISVTNRKEFSFGLIT